jgi:uncharacterized protein YkvS
MAKFINRKEEVIQFELTAYGKEKFSTGDFSPSFYAFYDSDVLYDGGYASFPSESQNDIVTRIKEVPRHSVITRFTSSEGNNAQRAINISKQEFGVSNSVSGSNQSYFKFFRPIGSNSPWSEYAPAWKIQTLEGSQPFIGGMSFNSSSISQASSSLPIEYTKRQLPPQEGDDGNPEIVEYILDNSGKVSLDITEKNTIFKANGNFDIEVYRLPQGADQSMKRLSFIDEDTRVGQELADQTDIVEFYNTLNGTEDQINEVITKLDNTYVEYFLNIRVDEEITELKIQKGETLYRSEGTNNPTDPCD